MSINLPLTERARRFGYVFWPKYRESEIRDVIGEGPIISVSAGGGPPRNLTVQWKYARIAVGKSWTNSLPQTADTFRLTSRDGVIYVTAK